MTNNKLEQVKKVIPELLFLFIPVKNFQLFKITLKAIKYFINFEHFFYFVH